jgi:hypothetical protein
MFVWVFFCCWVGIVSISIVVASSVFFFVLFVSFDASDAVYINRVIIPEENVRITISGSQLLVMFLYKYGVVKIEIAIRVTARVIGLIVVSVVMIRRTVVVVMFP